MGHGSCCHPVSKYSKWLPKIAFGLVLAGYGVNHLRNLDGFRGMAAQAYPALPALGMISSYLALLVPAFMIVGGVLFALGQMKWLSKLCIYASLSGIMGWAGLSVMLGDVSSGATMMPLIQNAAVLLILYYAIKKLTCCKPCGSGCGNSSCGCGANCTCPPGQCNCGNGSCNCK